MTARITIDAGPVTHLPLCSCGWRGDPVRTRTAALRQGHAHQVRAHPGDTALWESLARRGRRARTGV